MSERWEDMFDEKLQAKRMMDAIAKQKADAKAKRDKYNRSEAKLQKDICDALVDANVLVIRFNSSVQWTEHGSRLAAYRIVNTNATSGLSDIVIFANGRSAFLEVKRPKGRLSESQVKFSELAKRHGMTYHVVTSVDEAVAVATMLRDRSAADKPVTIAQPA